MADFITNPQAVSDRPRSAGEIADLGDCDIRTLPAEGGEFDKWTIAPAADPPDDTELSFDVTVVGVFDPVRIAITSDADSTKAEVAAAWRSAVMAQPKLGNAVKTSIVSDELVLEAKRKDVILKVTGVALGGGSVTNTTPGTTSGDIPFGRFVLFASNNEACKAVVNGDTNGAGIAVKYHVNERDTNGNAAWRPGDAVPVLQRGRIDVELDDGITIDATKSVFVRKGGSGSMGAFRDDADGGDAVALSSYGYKGRWIGTDTIGSNGKHIAELQIWPA